MYAETLRLIATAPRRRPSPRLHRALDALLARLADETAAPLADRTADAVWALWMHYPDRRAASELERATRAIVAEDYPTAEAILRRLVALHPGYAEAWHKRATLFYMQGRDLESVSDFHRTLVLEPRHYGAMLAFAELCVANAREDAALFALDAALRVNPHLPDARERYEALLARPAALAH
jgi:tetratricopeptide (TPR) repeat protein